MTFPLTLLHLQFDVEAVTPLRLSGFNAGSQLRGALGSVMRRAYCIEAYRAGGRAPGPAHVAECPVCWLLAANEYPGEERRGYSLRSPLQPRACYTPGERLRFGLTLFGSAVRYLPYFILAVPEAGREGLGTGRGQFRLRGVHALTELPGTWTTVLAEGDTVVRSPGPGLGATDVRNYTELLLSQLPENGQARVRLRFQTPLRLIENGGLLRAPDFGVIFKRLLHHLDGLARQYGPEASPRRAPDSIAELQSLADQVRLIEANTEWVDVWSGSTRRQGSTPIGGMIGSATFTAPRTQVWRELLPWVVWGTLTQTGKDTVKGNGVYTIES